MHFASPLVIVGSVRGRVLLDHSVSDITSVCISQDFLSAFFVHGVSIWKKVNGEEKIS